MYTMTLYCTGALYTFRYAVSNNQSWLRSPISWINAVLLFSDHLIKNYYTPPRDPSSPPDPPASPPLPSGGATVSAPVIGGLETSHSSGLSRTFQTSRGEDDRDDMYSSLVPTLLILTVVGVAAVAMRTHFLRRQKRIRRLATMHK